MFEKPEFRVLKETLTVERINDWYHSLGDLNLFFDHIKNDDIDKHKALQQIMDDYDKSKQEYSQDGFYTEDNVHIPQLTGHYGGIVAFVASEKNSKKSRGTGFFIRPNLLLTAYHVVADLLPGTEKGVKTGAGEFIPLEGSRIIDPYNSASTRKGHRSYRDIALGLHRYRDIALIEFASDVNYEVLKLSDDESLSMQPSIAVGYDGNRPIKEGLLTSFGVAYIGQQSQSTNPVVNGFSGGPHLSLDSKVIGMTTGSGNESIPSFLGISRFQLHITNIVPISNILKAVEGLG